MDKGIKALFVCSLFAKLLLALYVPLALDEYYYFLWGKIPSLSYFDHPPLVGWLMVLSQGLKGLADGAIRWPFLILSHLTLGLWLLMFLQEPGRPEGRAHWFLWIALLNPLWGLGSLVATPDIPLVFAWTLSLFASERVLNRSHFGDYLLLGFGLGIGFLAKYHIVLYLPALGLMLWQKKAWHKIRSPKTLCTLLLGGGLTLPVVWWNAQNNWASFAFQWTHGMSPGNWKWYTPLDYLGGQLLIVFPTFLFFFFMKSRLWRRHWLLSFALFPFAFFLYSSFKGRVEANWPLIGLPPLYFLASLYTPQGWWPWVQRTVYLWGGCLFIALGVVALPKGSLEWQTNLSKSEKFEPLLQELDPQSNTYYATNYQMAGFLSFHWDQVVCKFPHYGRTDHFSFMPRCLNFPKRFVLILEEGPVPPLARDFPAWEVRSQRSLDSGFMLIEIVTRP
jgi:hypothetical protein